MYDYGYTTDSVVDTTFNSAGLTGLFIGIMIFSLILSLIMIISYVKAFKKAGVSAANILWLFLPIPIVSNIVMALKIDPVKKFGKSSGYLIGLILLPIIFVPLIAFSDSKSEEVNSGTSNQFDANKVINSDNNVSDIPVQNISNIEENKVEAPVQLNVVNEVQTLEPAHSTLENVSTVQEEVLSINEEKENLVNEPPQLNSINEDQSVDESVNVVPEIPTQEVTVSTNFEPENIEVSSNENIVNAFTIEPVNEVQSNETLNEIPVAPIEPTVNSTDMNVGPIQSNEPASVFNMEPIAPDKVETLNSDDVVQEVPVLNEVDNKKKCRNCGTDMPDIVSICPSCGTDNE